MKRTAMKGYSFAELFVDEGGKTKACLIMEGTDRSENVSMPEQKEEPDLHTLFHDASWPLPCRFDKMVKGQDGSTEHYLETNVEARIKDVFDRIETLLRDYIYFNNPRMYKIVPQIILATYFTEYLDFMPRIMLIGCTDSGKTRIQDILTELMYRSFGVSNSSFPSVFREIDLYETSVIIDEFQDNTLKNDLYGIYKSGFSRRGALFTRCAPNSYKPESFHVYSPLVLSLKSIKGVPEDVINRSFVINMVEAPAKVRLKKILDPSGTELRNLRTELYRLMYIVEMRRNYALVNKRELSFEMGSFLEKCNAWISEKCEETDTPYPEQSRIPNSYPELRNRQFDIARSLYPFAYITDSIEALFDEITEMKQRNRFVLNESDYGVLMEAWATLIESEHPRTEERYHEISLKISTRDMRERLEVLQSDAKNYSGTKDPQIRTRDIKPALESMGFVTGLGTGNCTYVKDKNRYRETYYTNLKKYGSPERVKFFESLEPSYSNFFLTNSNKRTEPADTEKRPEVNELRGDSHGI